MKELSTYPLHGTGMKCRKKCELKREGVSEARSTAHEYWTDVRTSFHCQEFGKPADTSSEHVIFFRIFGPPMTHWLMEVPQTGASAAPVPRIHCRAGKPKVAPTVD